MSQDKPQHVLRDEFQVLLDQSREPNVDLKETWLAMCAEVAQKKRPRHRGPWTWAQIDRVLTKEDSEPLRAAFGEIQDRLFKEVDTRRQAAKKALYELAPRLVVQRAAFVAFPYSTHHGSTYRSSGDGEGYARGYAEIEVEEIQATRNVRAGVERVDDGGRDVYRVMVLVSSEFDVEILHYQPGWGMRDFFKACWRRALNPRVYFPGLAHGLEEKWGIDYQGNDLPRKEAP